MGQDQQIPRELEPESAPKGNALSKGSKTCGDVAADWLRLYAEMPYMREDHEITEAVILFYLDSLAPLRNPTALHRAFQWCRDHLKWLPQPSEIIEQYEIEAGKMIAEQEKKREAVELCGDCRGSGWKMVPRPDQADKKWAVACECRKQQITGKSA